MTARFSIDELYDLDKDGAHITEKRMLSFCYIAVVY